MIKSGTKYYGWKVIDRNTGQEIKWVVYVDDDDMTYCTFDQPFRVDPATNKPVSTLHQAQDIREDPIAKIFWVTRMSGTVAPLKSKDDDNPLKGKPCEECTQPEVCQRVQYCPQYRCKFGEVDKP